MSGVISKGNFPKALKEGVRSFFGMKYNEKEAQCEALFNTVKSERAYEEDVLASGLGLAPKKPEGTSVKYDSMEQGYVNRSTHNTYGLGFQITEEEMADNKYADLLASMLDKRAGQLAFSVKQTKEIVGANVYNNGFDTNFAFGDGKPMLAADHPTKTTDFSNVLATPADLSETSVEDGLVAVRQFTDNRGKKIAAMGEYLVVPSALTYEADRVLKSSLQTTIVGTSNTNAINAIKGSMMKVTNDYLTDDDAWFIRTNVEGLTRYQRREVAFTEDNDFDTDNMKFKATERYSFTCYDPRSIFGSAGAA